MRKVRGMIALIVALAIAGLVAYTVFGYLGKSIEEQPEPPAPEPVVKKQVIPPRMFSKRIQSGMRAVTLTVDTISGLSRELVAGDRVDVLAVTPIPGLTEGRVSRLLISKAQVLDVSAIEGVGGRPPRNRTVTLTVSLEDAAILATAGPAARLQLVMRNPADEDTTGLVATAFAPAGGISTYIPQKRDLETLVASGMRAITLEVAATDGIGGVFRPGDRVDVIVTCPWGNISLKSQDKPGEKAVIRETHRNSRILFQNIRVIATDLSLVWNTNLNQSVGRVTFEVTPSDAEKLAVLADSKKGKSIIRLIGRNREDRERIQTSGAELLDLLSKRRPYMRVDMIRGALRKDQTFYR